MNSETEHGQGSQVHNPENSTLARSMSDERRLTKMTQAMGSMLEVQDLNSRSQFKI
jgi:hypothetical protein